MISPWTYNIEKYIIMLAPILSRQNLMSQGDQSRIQRLSEGTTTYQGSTTNTNVLERGKIGNRLG